MTAQLTPRRGDDAAPQGPGSGKAGLFICSQCGMAIHHSALIDSWVHDDQAAWEKSPHETRPVEVTPALKFSEASHRYTLDGKPVPGVTGLIGGGLPKPALIKWAPRLVADYVIDNWQDVQDAYRHNPEALRRELQRLPEKKRDDAGARGTEVHALGEAIAHGREVDVPERLVPYVEGYARWLDKFDVRPTLTECAVASRQHWYAGTFDMFAESKLAPLAQFDLKGLALTTPIPTPTGWTTMGAVQPGDVVFGSDGRPCLVTAKSRVKRIGTYVVRFDDTSEIVCDSEHIWWTACGSESEPTPKGIDEIVCTQRSRNGQNHHRIPVAGPLDLPDADLPIDPYLLGCWLGDGTYSCGTITKGRDLFEILATDGHPLGKEQVDKRSGIITRTVLGLRPMLRSAGLLGHKHIPDVYLRASIAQRTALLQGLMDTDGTWNPARSRAAFNSTDKALAGSVEELVTSLGQRPHLSEVQTHGYGKDVTAYAVEFRPVGMAPFRLPRKAAKLADAMARPSRMAWGVRSSRRVIVSIEPGPDVETACIAVDSPNRTYLCGEHMIPTHNTSNNVYGATALQTAGYARAEFYLDGAFERPIPDLDATLVVHITPEGTKAHWLCRDRAEIDEAFQDFLAVAAVAKRVKRIDGRWDSRLRKAVGSYLSDPIEEAS